MKTSSFRKWLQQKSETISHFFDAQDARLMRVVGFYSVSITLFAIVYWIAYESNSQNFSFNRDIFSSQRSKIITEKKVELEKVMDSLKDVEDFSASVSRIRLNRDGNVPYLIVNGSSCIEAIMASGKKLQLCGLSAGNRLMSAAVTQLQLDCIACEGGKHRSTYGPATIIPATKAELETIGKKWMRDLSSTVSMKETQLNSFLDQAGSSDIWSFPDFIYFSLSVQLGGSFGDIIPNSAMIRLATSFQLMVTTYLVFTLARGSKRPGDARRDQ